MNEEIDFWDMECVKISDRKLLDDLTYAQKIRDEQREQGVEEYELRDNLW